MLKKIEFYTKVVIETIFYLMMSSSPIWAVILLGMMLKKSVYGTLTSALAGFVSVCIPILFFGLSAFSPKSEDVSSSWLWKLSTAVYTIAVAFFVITELFFPVDAVVDMYLVWFFAIIIFATTFISCFYQKKDSMIKKFKPEISRQEEQDNAEQGAFDD